jgi:hypothetical protein
MMIQTVLENGAIQPIPSTCSSRLYLPLPPNPLDDECRGHRCAPEDRHAVVAAKPDRYGWDQVPAWPACGVGTGN